MNQVSDTARLIVPPTSLVEQTEAFAFPSVTYDLPFEIYKKIPVLNSHGATTIIEESLYHFKYERDHPTPATRAKNAGSLVHELLLEPDKRAYRVLPELGNKNSILGLRYLVGAYSEWLQVEPPPSEEKAESKRLKFQLAHLEELFALTPLYTVKLDDMEAAQRTVHNVFEDLPLARDLLADGHPEVTLLWESPIDGCKKKARVDWLPDGHAITLDIKTIDRAGYRDCERAVLKFNYDYQGQWYTEGAEYCYLGKRVFVILFLERTAPFKSRLFYLTDEDMREAARRNHHAASLYNQALATDDWPGYPQTIDPMIMPKYRYK